MEKRLKLRHNEYYNLQPTFDNLFSLSKAGNYFTNLVEIMKSEANILLAYRNIKRNKGANTPGVDNLTMIDIAKLQPQEVIRRIQSMFDFYTPLPVRRKMIPKPNGKFRPLGIPCIWDRLFQQCILQILEPICEAKFHKHSYGFRPNRSTHHAIARMNFLIYRVGLHHCVDIDIRGFFDNVNHGKLLKQMWAIGIRDKKLLSIISALVKAEIEGEGKPDKGTPQGGILSPLLSNIVLNELDWWVSNQWETFKTKHNYVDVNKNRALQKTKLKEVYIVRYADDFKILCKTRNQATRIKIAVQDFLDQRLRLTCSEEKSKIVNLKKQWSEFLGFKIKAYPKSHKYKRIWTTKRIDGEKKNILASIERETKYVSISRMTDKAKKNAIDKVREAIRHIQKTNTPNAVKYHNQVILGIQQYYKIASGICMDLSEITLRSHKTLYNRLGRKAKRVRPDKASPLQQKKIGERSMKLVSIRDIVLLPICTQNYVAPKQFNPLICNYTEEGRQLIHKKLILSAPMVLGQMSDTSLSERSIEYHDNRISKYLSQYGTCYVTGIVLGYTDWHCHHMIPYHKTKDDSFQNLVVVHKEIHKLIHMTNKDAVRKSVELLYLDKKSLKRLNYLRKQAGNEAI